MTVKIKRIYEVSDVEDGTRILVDRLWPRGVKKEDARIDLWLKDIGPSSDLRKWFGHDPKRWPQFRAKYIQELGLKKGTCQSSFALRPKARSRSSTLPGTKAITKR
jgi:uncharacterized protein YeaO (DUF488 family)